MASRKHILLLSLLIIIAGLIPYSVYFLESNTSLDVDIASLPNRSLLPSEQQAQAFAGLIVKPAYMMLSLAIILLLIGQSRTPIRALQWGQTTFLVGETFCAINFYIYKHESILSEYLHSYGMVLAFGFTSFALIDGWITRFTRRNNPKSMRGARGSLYFLLPILAVLCFIPIQSSLQPDAYTVSILGFPYTYTRLNFYQNYEHLFLPILALIAFTISFVLLLWNRDVIPQTTIFFLCGGLGALGFSFFRVALNALFVDNLVWFEFWEEVTELMFVGTVGFVLWHYKNILLEKTTYLELITKKPESP